MAATDTGRAATSVRTVAPGTPYWATWTAYGTVLSVLPSGIWRTAVGLGVPLGWSDAHLRLEHIPGDGTRYVISLTVLSIVAALLTLGLIYRWGEVVPRPVPLLGGRVIPLWAVLIPALCGAAVVLGIEVASVLNWHRVSGFAADPYSGWAVLMAACYGPGLLWSPLLAATTVAYWRRRRSG